MAKDNKLERANGVEVGFLVKAGALIYGGALTATDPTGYLVRGSDSAGLIFQGVSMDHYNNSSGQNGDLIAALLRRGLVKSAIAAVTIADIGKNVFIVDDNTVALTANVTNKIFCGIIAGIIDSTTVWVDIEPAIKQADLAAHIAAVAAAHSASAIALADAGSFFGTDNAEAALQTLAKTIVIAIPHFTGWAKDGTDKAIAIPPVSLPVPAAANRYAKPGPASPSSCRLARVKK